MICYLCTNAKGFHSFWACCTIKTANKSEIDIFIAWNCSIAIFVLVDLCAHKQSIWLIMYSYFETRIIDHIGRFTLCISLSFTWYSLFVLSKRRQMMAAMLLFPLFLSFRFQFSLVIFSLLSFWSVIVAFVSAINNAEEEKPSK